MMEEYFPELERMLFHLALYGSAFKKTYYEPAYTRVCSKFVKAEDIVVPYYATDLSSCDIVTHCIQTTSSELRRSQVSGFYRDIELQESPSGEVTNTQQEILDIEGRGSSNDGEIYNLYETYVDYDLPGFEDID